MVESKVVVKYITSDNSEEDKVKLTIDDELKKVFRKVALVSDDTNSWQIGGVSFKRYKVKSFIMNRWSGWHLVMFNKDLLDKGTCELPLSRDTYLLLLQTLRSDTFKNMVSECVNYGDKEFTLAVGIEPKGEKNG